MLNVTGVFLNGTHLTWTSAGVTPTVFVPTRIVAPGGSLSMMTLWAQPIAVSPINKSWMIERMLSIVADSELRYPLRMKISALIPFLFIFGCLISTTSHANADPSTPDKKERKRRANPKKEAKELELLQRSATLYWEGVRWNDIEKSAAFIENSNDRMEFQQWLEDKIEGHKIMEARVLRVDVEPVTERKSTITKVANLAVSMHAYKMPEQVLKKEIFHQRWYRKQNGWWLEWTSPIVEARKAATSTDGE